MLRSKGCPRCRCDRIRFIQIVELPRFTMQPGEEWISPEIAYTADGGVKLGAGIAPRGSFQIVERDYERAIHRDCTGRWP